jgi:hypothetical protein
MPQRLCAACVTAASRGLRRPANNGLKARQTLVIQLGWRMTTHGRRSPEIIEKPDLDWLAIVYPHLRDLSWMSH